MVMRPRFDCFGQVRVDKMKKMAKQTEMKTKPNHYKNNYNLFKKENS